MSTPVKIVTHPPCLQCGGEMIRKRYGRAMEDVAAFLKRKFCNQSCMARNMERMKVANEHNSHRQSGKAVKPLCEVCGRSASRLHVHHIDHNPMNNDAANLQTLCASCHRLSHSPNYLGTPLQPKPCAHCSRPVARQGLCNTHLTRLKRYGDPLLKKFKTGSGWQLQKVNS